MLSRKEFIMISLETNLFFQRIMKEHLFFIQTNLKPVQADNIATADQLKQSFERLLSETVKYANGAVSEYSIKSNEFVTPYTLKAEELTSALTGASLNTEITKAELKLTSNPNFDYTEALEKEVFSLNAKSLNLVKEVIVFKKKLILLSSECKIFISMYPEMLEHITREAEYYNDALGALQEKRLIRKTLCQGLNFWNDIMGEHGEFIDGMLDPTEKTLKKTAETFAEKFEALVKECINAASRQVLQGSINNTRAIIDYKRAATEGLLACKIKSIIPPLLADHVLREANHYMDILRTL